MGEYPDFRVKLSPFDLLLLESVPVNHSSSQTLLNRKCLYSLYFRESLTAHVQSYTPETPVSTQVLMSESVTNKVISWRISAIYRPQMVIAIIRINE